MKQYLLPASGSFYRINTHSHSTLSDGNQTPDQLKEAYLAMGYSAIAYTEHEGIFDLSRLTDDRFVALTSYEYAFIDMTRPAFSAYEGKAHTWEHAECVHLNLYARDPHNVKHVCYTPKHFSEKLRSLIPDPQYVGAPDFDTRHGSVEAVNELIAAAHDNGMLIFYNHPNWSLNTSDSYTKYEGLDGFEIINGASQRASDLDCYPHVYDQLARTGHRMICVGGDDNHGTVHFGTAWTMVKADELSYDALMDGLARGNTYASDGPSIFDLYLEDNKLHVTCSDAVGVFLTTAGRRKECRLSEHDAPPVNEAVFTVKPDDWFFRVTVRDARGHHAFSRFYYVDELDPQLFAQK